MANDSYRCVNICVEVVTVCESNRPWQRVMTFKSIEPFKTAGIDADSLERKKVHGEPSQTYYVNAATSDQIQPGFIDLQVSKGSYANMIYLGPNTRVSSKLAPPSLVPKPTTTDDDDASKQSVKVEETTFEILPAVVDSLIGKVESSASSPNGDQSSEMAVLRSRITKSERQIKDLNDLLIEMAKMMVSHIGKNAKMLHE